MEYSFQPFLEGLSDDWFADDELLLRLVEHHADPDEARRADLRRTGRLAAGRLRELAERSARPEKRPRLEGLVAAAEDPETTVAFARWAEEMVAAFADRALRAAGAA